MVSALLSSLQKAIIVGVTATNKNKTRREGTEVIWGNKNNSKGRLYRVE